MDPSIDTARFSRRRRWVAGGLIAGLVPALGWWLRAQRGREEHASPRPEATPTLKGRAPSLFIGHGSPMNALSNNDYTRALNAWGLRLGIPRAILMVSAHWLTDGEWAVSTVESPGTIHDFGGFPRALHELQYPAPGSPFHAKRAAGLLDQRGVRLDPARGLDHGAWSVLKHLYPKADVPVFQLSINMRQGATSHAEVGAALAPLRDQGVLIIGSGNIVHNLRISLDDAGSTRHGLLDWAEDFDQRVKQALDARDHRALAAYEQMTAGALTAVPFPDHYYPMLYSMGAAQSSERVEHVFEGFQEGTFSMRCIQWG